jgi:transcriptional regulator with XRE-family HTH domain
MSLQEAFSENLSRLCGNADSVSAVAKATGINRQQFQRYISGGSIPGKRNLRKICRYFRVSEEQLFGYQREARAPQRGDEPWASQDEMRAVLKLIHSDARPSIRDGAYFANFAVYHDRSSLVRSALFIRHEGNMTTFRRFTGIGERRGSWWSQFFGDHKGIVVERAHWLYFIGLNGRGNREPTIMVVRWLSGSQFLLGGQAIVSGSVGPSAAAVVISPAKPGISTASAIKASHMYSIDDPSIEQFVVDALDEQAKLLIDNVRRPDLRVRSLSPRQRAHNRQ